MAPRIRIIVAQFNPTIVDPMILAAQEALHTAGAHVQDIIRVPGCYEIPLTADLLLKRGEVDALVILGYIEKGETLHGEVMGHVVHHSIVQLQLQYSIPIAIGIIGPGATLEQATERNQEYAIGAAECAIQMVEVADKLKTLVMNQNS